MRRYSEAVKADVRRRMGPPHRQSVAEISKELGIHVITLYKWRKAWRLRRLSKSELVRRALTAFLQSSELEVEGGSSQSAADLLADLVGCCEGGPADLSSNPAYLSAFGGI